MKNIHNKKLKLFSVLALSSLMFITACTNNSSSEIMSQDPVSSEKSEVSSSETSNNIEVNVNKPEKDFNEGVVLVKYSGTVDSEIVSQLDVKSITPLYNNSKWYSVELRDTSKTVEAVSYLRELGCFEDVDYDYVMGTSDKPTNKEDENPNYSSQTNLGLHNIPYGWTQNGKYPGGSSDVVVAVIDTGIDYNHLDLRNNIWTNPAEIPNNNKDDDNNGYIDDYYGWDCVGNDNDPMDDNGHGTHVAGIIAAENNKLGGIGVAYGCKVMAIKAGNSSGYFNNSDIAEAIQYAYMNGASVINMSFGGSFISVAVEDALENAYNSCVLVAAAGNESACNNLACEICVKRGVSYPAALSYVIGVMSTGPTGENVSSFSNYDHYPHNSIEYEVYAVGEAVSSTWPDNKYTSLNGTSMAAPTVSGIAALLRSKYPDRNTYATKYLQSQIVNTGTINPYNFWTKNTDTDHSVANIYSALNTIPTPSVYLYDYEIDDNTSISAKNNNNGVIDAGETVRLRISLQNRGGVAKNVNVTIDTLRSSGATDEYFTFVNDSISLSDIGTYSIRESGEDKYFEIQVSNKCPNDYLANFNIHFTYKNGLDDTDNTLYTDDGEQVAQFNVSSGYHLEGTISEDTIFTNDRLYIISDTLTITSGTTVTFEEGCQIQFYADVEYYNSPKIVVYGTLNINGTKDSPVDIFPSERYAPFACIIENNNITNINYINSINLVISNKIKNVLTTISNSTLLQQGTGNPDSIYWYNGGKAEISSTIPDRYPCVSYYNSFIDITTYAYEVNACNMENNYIHLISGQHSDISVKENFNNNILISEFPVDKNYYAATEIKLSGEVQNNIFYSLTPETLHSHLTFTLSNPSLVSNNLFSDEYKQYANQFITNYLDSYGNPIIDMNTTLSDESALYPHVSSVEIHNIDGEQITTIGKEDITVKVTFSTPMDTTKNVSAYFGTIEPYADYKIDGSFINDTVWVGSYSLKAYIENGLQTLIIKGACAADDPTKEVQGKYQPYSFNIDTTAAMSMDLFATPTDTGVKLEWRQDDYETLMGYNIYRSTSKDGFYTKINQSVLLPSENTFTDENAEPGVTYWYTFTVVLSDFTESAPAGKIYCTAIDTINPTIYHTPVNQGYENNNLVISCTASDNMKISTVTVYYKTYGETAWKSITMSKVNDKYNATIFGSELDMAGLEYYIVASDGQNSISKGSEEVPFFVIIKDASTISHMGDVDGNGMIDTKDALMIMRFINNDLMLTTDEFNRANLNNDDQLSSSEALRILQYINGNVPDLNM